MADDDTLLLVFQGVIYIIIIINNHMACPKVLTVASPCLLLSGYSLKSSPPPFSIPEEQSLTLTLGDVSKYWTGLRWTRLHLRLFAFFGALSVFPHASSLMLTCGSLAAPPRILPPKALSRHGTANSQL